MMSDESELIKQIIDIERRWAAAHINLDLDVIESILAEDYRGIQANGTVINREELIQSYRSGLRRWEIAESDDYEIWFYGSVAMMIGHWRGKGENNGKGFDYSARFLALYRLDDGQWQLVSDVSVPLDE